MGLFSMLEPHFTVKPPPPSPFKPVINVGANADIVGRPAGWSAKGALVPPASVKPPNDKPSPSAVTHPPVQPPPVPAAIPLVQKPEPPKVPKPPVVLGNTAPLAELVKLVVAAPATKPMPTQPPPVASAPAPRALPAVAPQKAQAAGWSQPKPVAPQAMVTKPATPPRPTPRPVAADVHPPVPMRATTKATPAPGIPRKVAVPTIGAKSNPQTFTTKNLEPAAKPMPTDAPPPRPKPLDVGAPIAQDKQADHRRLWMVGGVLAAAAVLFSIGPA